MIEWSAHLLNTWVRELKHELKDVTLVECCYDADQAKLRSCVRHVLDAEVATTVIVVEGFMQGRIATVVHIRSGQCHVTQHWRLECTIHSQAAIRIDHVVKETIIINEDSELNATGIRQWHAEWIISADAEIFERWSNTDVVVPNIVCRVDCIGHWHELSWVVEPKSKNDFFCLNGCCGV